MPGRGPDKKPRKPRPDKRQHIMESALRVLAQNGYGGTTYDMIAKEAGVTKGLIINHYVSKENLAITAIHQFVQDFADAVEVITREETHFAPYTERVALLFKKHLQELRLLISMSVTPAHMHLVNDIWSEVTQQKMYIPAVYKDEIGADIFEAIIRQMMAQHFNYVINGNEESYDKGRRDILNYLDNRKT